MTKHTSESQTSGVELLPLTACAGTGRNGCADSISSAHVQAVASIKTKMSTGRQEKIVLGSPKRHDRVTKYLRAPYTCCVSGPQPIQIRDVNSSTFFLGCAAG